MGDVVELEVSANYLTSHAFHIHSVPFQVVSYRTEHAALSFLRGRWYDVIMIPAGGVVVLRARFDWAGMVMAHCHVLIHSELGMMSWVAVQ